MKSHELPILHYQCSCWIWLLAQLLLLPEIQNIGEVIHLMPQQLWHQAKEGWRNPKPQIPWSPLASFPPATAAEATDAGTVIAASRTSPCACCSTNGQQQQMQLYLYFLCPCDRS